MTTFADEQCGDLCAIKYGATTNSKPNPGADEEATKNRRQKFVGRHVGIFDESQAGR